MQLVDSHTHVVSTDEQRYARQPTGAGSTWWQNPNGVEELTRNLDEAGVDRAVVVQAVGVYGYDCTYAADVTADTDRFAFVGAVNMSDDSAPSEFESLAASTDLDGLRLFGVNAEGPGWLTSGIAEEIWRMAQDLQTVLIPTLFANALPMLAPLLEKFPDVEVALDHSAFPDFGGPDAFDQLAQFAQYPSLSLKVTAHNLDTDEDPAKFTETMLESYGPTRICWGSDHPQHQSKTYPELLAIAQNSARNLSESDRSLFLGGNAERLWWSDPPTESGSSDAS